MRARCATGCADNSDGLTLFHDVANLHKQARAVKKGTVETHAMIDHQQIAFEREWMISSENDNAIGWRDVGRPCAASEIDTAMIARRCPPVDTLGAKAA
jgi:hypothetical protein